MSPLLWGFFLLFGVAHAQDISPWTATDTIDLIAAAAAEYQVSSSTMTDIVNCETGYNLASTSMQSYAFKKDGTREPSFGLAQIDRDYWPGITHAQAVDPVFSITFLAKHLQANEGHLWACYREK